MIRATAEPQGKQHYMWNPDSYRDTDFGLSREERFEPTTDLEEDYRPKSGEPFVMTVLGPIRPDEVGVALIREHLQWSPVSQTPNPETRLDDPLAALSDLEAFFTVSGRTVVTATPAGAGRDANELLWLAQRAPVHIVGASGWVGGDGSTALEQIATDFEQGMDGTAARPGVMVIDPAGANPASLRNVAGIREASGVPLLSLAPAQRQRESVERLTAAGVPGERIIVAGAGSLVDRDLDWLLDTGAFLLFDEVGVSRDNDARMAGQIVAMTADGHAGRLLLSHGFRRRSLLTGYQGRPGYAYVIEQFAVMLLEDGLEALDVRRMLVDNTVTALAGVSPDPGA